MAPFKSRSKSGSIRVNQTINSQYARTREFPPLKVPAPFQGFVDFIREQGVVGLGVGFVIGTAANTLVKSIVANILNPFIGLFTGGKDLSQKVACLKTVGGVCKDPLNYGQVISDTITFIIILMVVYVVIKSLKLDKLDKKKA